MEKRLDVENSFYNRSFKRCLNLVCQVMIKRVKNYLAFFVILLSSTCVSAQDMLSERRVYYLDATYSMVYNKLWESSKENLIKAIENIDDINTELIVVVFADDVKESRNVWKLWEEKATDAGKTSLISKIKELPLPLKTTMTNLYRPWNDFYSQTKEDKVNYMFLMTDGGHEGGGNRPSLESFLRAIDEWGDKTGALTYGFLVELTENVGESEINSRNKAREHIDRQKERLWRVSSADVNISLVRLGSSVKFNVRNDTFIDIPVFLSVGDVSTIKNLKFDIVDSDSFKIRKTEITEDNVRIYIDSDIDVSTFPVSSNLMMKVSLPDHDDKTFLLTEAIKVSVVNKKERSLKMSRNRITGKVMYYDSFGFVKSRTSPFETQIDLEWSTDACADSGTFASFIVTDNMHKRLSETIVSFIVEENTKNEFSVRPPRDKLQLSVIFPEGTKTGTYQGYLTLENHRLDRINNKELDGTDIPIIAWRIRYLQIMNPLAKGLMWLGILALFAFLLWFFAIKPVKYPCFPQFRKMILVKRNGFVVANFSTNFRGARKVVFTDKKVRQSIINRIFTGKIIVVLNPIFKEPITFIPQRKKALVKGEGYICRPNPIPQSGVAVIEDPVNKITMDIH